MNRRISQRPGSRCAGATPVSLLRLALGLILVAALAGCSASDEVSPADEQAISESLAQYLPGMANAYATGDLEPLRGIAAEKEIATLHKKINDLMNEEGRIVEPTLRGFDIEDVTIWSYSNAFVTTLETWDFRVLASGTDTVTSEVDGQRQRVKYQMKRRDEGWQVLYRVIETTFES